MPFKPTAILNYKNIDNELAGVAVDFWQLTWEKEGATIDLKTKLMLSIPMQWLPIVTDRQHES